MASSNVDIKAILAAAHDQAQANLKAAVEADAAGGSSGTGTLSNLYGKVDNTFINTFIRNAGKFFDDQAKAYDNLTYSAALNRDGKNARINTWNSLSYQAGIIKNFILENKGSLDWNQDWEDLLAYTSNFDKNVRDMNASFDEKYAYFDQFENENDWKWFEKYQGNSSDDLRTMMEGLEDGDEKTWLDNYAQQVYFSELPGLDLKKAQSKVDYLENLLDVYRKNTRFFTNEQGQRWVAEIEAAYGGEDGLLRAISREKKRITEATWIQENEANAKKFGDVVNQPDFAKYSAYDPNNTELVYRYINGTPVERFKLEQQYGQIVKDFGDEAFDSLTDEEKGIYNYYANTGDWQAAGDYLKYIQDPLNKRKGAAAAEAFDDQPWLRYVYAGVVGLDQYRSSIEGFGDMIAGREGYKPPSATQYAAAGIREDLGKSGKKLPEWLGGGTWGQAAFDTITTSANMAPSILMSSVVSLLNPAAGAAVGRGMMGAGAAGSGYRDMLNQGYSVDQARTYGALVGAAEIFMEKFLGGIGKLGSKPAKAIARWAGNLDSALMNFAVRFAGNGMSEATEEGLQELLDTWLRRQITKEDFQYDTAEAMYSSLLGFVTGSMFEAPNAAIDIGTRIGQGQQVRNADGADALVKLGRESADADVQAAAKWADNHRSAYNMGKLKQSVEADIHSQNAADISASLVAKGMDKKSADQTADAMARILEDGSEADIRLLATETDPIIGKTMREVQMKGTPLYQRMQTYRGATGTGRNLNQVAAQYGDKANAIKAAYEEGQDVEDFAHGVERVFTHGKEGGKQELLDQVAPDMSAQQRMSIYMIGQDAAAQEKAAAAKRYTGEAPVARVLNEDGSVGEAVRIEEVTSKEGGQWTYKTSDGQVLTDDQLSFSGDHAVLDTVKALDLDAKTASVMISGNNTISQPDAAVAQGIEDAYRYGSHGYSMERLLKDSEAAGILTEEMRQAAYDAGKNKPAKAKPSKAKPKTRGTKPGVYFDNGNGQVKAYDLKSTRQLKDTQKAGVQTAVVLQRLGIGTDFYFFESYVKDGKRVYRDEKGVERPAPNGWYDPNDDSIHIDLNAGNSGQGLTLYTMAHELTHFIEEWSKEKYKVLADFLIRNYEKDRSVDDLVHLKQEALSQGRDKPVTYEEAYSEVIADSMEAMLSDGNVLEKLAELKAEDEGLVRKMKAFFDSFVKKIRSIYAELKPESAEGQLVLEMKDQFEQLQQLFAEALADAGENYRNAAEGDADKKSHGERKYQARKGMADSEISAIQNIGKISINKFTSQHIKATEKLAKKYWEEMGIKSPFFRAWFGDWRESDHSLVYVANQKGNTRGVQHNDDTGWDINVSGQVFNETKNHRGLANKSAQSYLPYINDIVRKAVLLDSYGIDAGKAKSDNSLLMHSMYAIADIGNGPEVLKLYVEEMNNPASDQTTKRSYQLQNIEKAFNASVRVQGQAPSSLTSTLNAVKIVADLFAAVKQYDTAFAPNPVSKAVNSDGKPLEMYHGTSNGGFTMFNTYGGKFGLFGKGSYFTDNPTVADSYTRKGKGKNPEVYGAYLNIKNPLDMDSKADLNAWKKAFDNADLDRSYLDGVVTNEDAFRALKENLQDEGYVRWEAEDLVTELIEGMGYDGITHIGGGRYGSKDGPKHRVYIAFEPEQIKSSTENIGTFDSTNPDIRYQDRPTAPITNRALLANALESTTQDETELTRLREYRMSIDYLNEQEATLTELRRQIREISFGKGPRDTAKLKQLQEEATKTANRINVADKKLLRLEAAKPLQRVLERERGKAYRQAQDRNKEVLARRQEGRNKTALKKKIQGTIRELDKIFSKGTKQRNVKQGMRDFVATALKSAEVLFADNYSNEDMVRSGVGVDLTAEEARLLHETQQLLTERDQLYSEDAISQEMELTVSGDLKSYEQRMTRSVELDRQILRNMGKLKGVFERERNRLNSATVTELLNNLAAEYRNLGSSDDMYIRAVTNEDVYQYLLSLAQNTGGTLVKDMSQEQLLTLHKAYKMVLSTIRNANNAFVDGKSIEAEAKQLVGEMQAVKVPSRKIAVALRNLNNSIGWNYEKLYYALDRINSPTLTRLFGNLAESENITMQDVREAKAFQMEMVEKYHYNDWDVEKRMDHVFVDNTGREFRLTLGQAMALYAYSRRENTDKHLEYGGFKLGKAALTDAAPATTYKLTPDQVKAVTNILTPEQRLFAEAMQKYLSETMGAKGNEVSMKLYGIEMFGEENYFPLHIAGEYKPQARESQAKEQAGFQSMSNAGFTKARNENATEAIVLENFLDVWVDHVNEMSRYHGAVPALEDIRRVMNYIVYSDSVNDRISVHAAMENAFGNKAVEYFDNLYREANSGAISDKMDAGPKKLLSLFRKNAVAYSLSVVIQQPASIYRARSLVNRKYFGVHGLFTITRGTLRILNRKKWNAAYNEMLKYAPGVTMTKEIGGFDTSTGSSIRSYLMDTEKGFFQSMKHDTLAKKANTVLGVVDDNVIANLPEVADKIAWIEMWEAVKRETVAKNKNLSAGSEAFYKKVGERFTEVVRATQVYDSMFSKSPMLKSKNLIVQSAISFMNEPNTVANMAESAVRNLGRRNYAKAIQTAAALTVSIVITNVLKSLVYAMRDKDEDEMFIEKYISAIVENLMNDINILNYIPFTRDGVSIFQGYDVERADMAIIADVVNPIIDLAQLANKDVSGMTEKELEEWDRNCIKAKWQVAEGLASLFGIPLRNIRRDFMAIINTVNISQLDRTRTATELSIRHMIQDAVFTNRFSSGKSDSDKLYEAIVSGDTDYADRLKNTYESDESYHSSIRKALRAHDPRIKQAAQAYFDGDLVGYDKLLTEIEGENQFDFRDIKAAIDSEVRALEKAANVDEEAPEVESPVYRYTAEDYFRSLRDGNMEAADLAYAELYQRQIDEGYLRHQAKSNVQSALASQIKSAYMGQDISREDAIKLLQDYAGKGETDVKKWDFELEYEYAWGARSRGYWLGEISEKDMVASIMDIEGATIEEAQAYIDFLDLAKKNEDIEITASQAASYFKTAEPAGISVEVYLDYKRRTTGITNDVDAKGEKVEYSAVKKIMQVINSLHLTPAQKTALAKSQNWKDSTIEKYKLW